jgi:hypothetical protein
MSDTIDNTQSTDVQTPVQDESTQVSKDEAMTDATLKRKSDEELEQSADKKAKIEDSKTSSTPVSVDQSAVPVTTTTDAASSTPQEPAKPKSYPYIPWQNCTVPMLKATLIYAQVYAVPDKARIVKISFDYGKYKAMFPDAPGYSPKEVGLLYVNAPWLRTPFGYSPRKANNNVQNNLRLQFSRFIDQDECIAFQARTKEWDEYFISTLYEHAAEWPLDIELEEGETLTDKMVGKKYTRINRKARKPGFPDYMSLRFQTLTKNEKLGILADDKYHAFVDVWNYQRKLLAEELTQKNNTDNKDKDAVHHIPKESYVRATFVFEKLCFSSSNGPAFMVSEVMVADERELRGMGSKDETKEKSCPFEN